MSTPSYFLRNASQTDLEFVLRLHRDTLWEYLLPQGGAEERALEDMIRRWFKPEQLKIIQVDGRDVGLLGVLNREDDVFIESISLITPLQKRGLGRRILADVLDSARAAGLPARLFVRKTNPARRLYEHLGFRLVGGTDKDFEMLWEAP